MAKLRQNSITFINCDNSKEEHLREAAKFAGKEDIDVVWIHAKDVQSTGFDSSSVIVLDPFEGKHFDYLKSKNCRIFGPQCIITCIEARKPLPSPSHPVYSLSMEGVFACCSSVAKSDRQKLHSFVQLMGGVIIRDFTDAVTHLIAGEVGSKKYVVACSEGKKIMLPDWVYAVWEEGKDKHVLATDEQFDKYKCPIFKGCTISVTGLDAATRQDVKQQCNANGGTYSGELNMNTCTHLLVNVPKGDKYEFARKWSIHCVSTQWFYDCVKSGFWLDESSYETLADEESQLSQPGSRLHVSQTASSTFLSTRSRTSQSNTKAAQAAYKSAQTRGDGGLIADNRTKGNTTLTSDGTSKNSSSLPDLDLTFNIIPGCMFLDGCKIFLSGFDGVVLDKLRKAINAGGGTRFNMISEIVSHVVIGQKVANDIEILQKCEFHPYIVTAHWIIDSAKNGKQMSEEDYIHPDFKLDTEKTPSYKENKKPTNSNASKSNNVSLKTSKKSSNKQQKSLRAEIEDELDDDEVFMQYTSQIDQQTKPASTQQHKDSTVNQLDDDDDDKTDDDDTTIDDNRLLAGLSFVIMSFSGEQVAHLEKLIEDNGGDVSTEKEVDYAILPMNVVCSDKNAAKEIVTFCWLEQCLQDNTLLNPDSSFLFRCFLIPEDISPLKGCVLTISQYLGVERDHLMQLAELLGAKCQEHFVHKANMKYLASTHLLCQEPDGSKYHAALKWNIPTVNKQWLFSCAKNLSLQPVEKYPVSNEIEQTVSPSKEEMSTVQSHKTANPEKVPKSSLEKAGEGGRTPIGRQQQQKSTDPQASNTAIQLLKKPFRPSFDLADAMEELESPLVPSLRSRKSRASRNSFPLDDFFQEHIQQAVKRTGNLGPGVSNLVKGDQDGSDYGEDNKEKEQEERGILHGVVLAVSKKLHSQQTELYGIASSLGADYRWVFDNSCTHLVHQGRTNDTTKEYTTAKEHHKSIVSPHWLHACAEANERVDEKLYPHTYNPKLSLQGVTKGRRLTRSSKTELDVTIQNGSMVIELQGGKQEKQSSEDRITTDSSSRFSEESKGSKDTSQKNDSETSDPKDDLQKQIENFISAQQKGVRSRRRSRRQTSTSSCSNPHNSVIPSCEGENDSRTTSMYSSRLRNRNYDQRESDPRNGRHQSDEAEHSQSDTITYDDPAGRLERERIMARMKGNSPSPTPDDLTDDPDHNDDNDIDDNKVGEEIASAAKGHTSLEEQINANNSKDTDSSQSTQTPEAPPLALHLKEVNKPTPQNLLKDLDESPSKVRQEVLKFQLSAMTPQEKTDYSYLIEELGGVVFDTQYFKTDCSHVVVGKPNRNEKYLAAMAAGKWVLHKSYLEDSRQAGYFVEEEPHEWGTDVPGEQPNKLALAARRWRLKLKEQRQISDDKDLGAFSGWRVLLCVDKQRQAGFKRLLEAGGACVVGSRPPFNSIDNVSHAFVDSNKMKPGTLDIDSLYNAGIWLVKPDYIAEFLMHDPEPHPGRYLIPEAARLADPNTSVQRKRKGDDMCTDEKRLRME